MRKGWPSGGLPGPVAAVFEKEIRGFVRSPPLMVFILVMPLVVLLPFLFGYGGAGAHRDAGAFLAHTPDLALPVGVAYALALLTNLSHNFLGGEGGGVQFLFVSPVRFRMIALGKNLAYALVVVLQLVLLWVVVAVMSRPPSQTITLVTLAALLFAVPVEFSAGNLLSVWFPKRVDYGKFGRQRTSGMTTLASLVVHAAVFGVAALVMALAGLHAGLWAAVPVLLVLAAATMAGYLFLLSRLDGIAMGRRETIVTELSRTDTA